ncbi:hypothetical protein Q7P37_000100 [Cladosporium fusiforme]
MKTRSQTDSTKRKRPSSDDGSASNDRSEPKPKPKPNPRLTTPDLEFDFDRSQLRDPRPTPGRKARPRWKKPRAYNKKSIVSNMDKALESGKSKDEQIATLFFKGGATEEATNLFVMQYVQDQVSKDLGVPFHQIDPAQVKEWREKGFEPVDYDTWWKKPNEVEKNRMSKMTMGSSLRKRL